MKCTDVREELVAYIDGELSSMGVSIQSRRILQVVRNAPPNATN